MHLRFVLLAISAFVGATFAGDEIFEAEEASLQTLQALQLSTGEIPLSGLGVSISSELFLEYVNKRDRCCSVDVSFSFSLITIFLKKCASDRFPHRYHRLHWIQP